MSLHRRTFTAIGCRHTVIATDGDAIEAAEEIARDLVADLDVAASRFRADSEISALARLAARGDAAQVVSPLLASCIAAALHAARITGGLVDPTVGAALVASGYDADLSVVRTRRATRDDVEISHTATVPGWQTLTLDPRTRLVTLARGTLVDVGATGKAHAADLVARRLAERLPGGFLVNLGGDIAVSGDLPGDPPDRGWDIGVEDQHGEVRQVVVSTGQAITTSSTQHRIWSRGGERRHHIVDPRTGRTADPHWAQVTCAGANAVEANAASTAAVVLGPDASRWLEANGIPARLDPLTGPPVTTTGWPAPERRAA